MISLPLPAGALRLLLTCMLWVPVMTMPASAAESGTPLEAPPDANSPPQAQTAKTPEPPPNLPELDELEENVEPTVTVIHTEERIVEEYRVNGQLRYAKITPKAGQPYYMVDTDGDGILDKRDDNLDNPPINQWILFRW